MAGVIAGGIAVFWVALAHAVRARYGWNSLDEGFLWNGVLRIGQGRIPIRDYKSYDPARFYWCWGWMQLFGRGLLGLRRGAAVFQALGVWAGLGALGTVTGNVPVLVLAGAVFVIWMQPRHKVFEHAMSLIAVFAVTLLLGAPSAATALIAGLATGFAGFLGRNHGAYGFAASGLALLYLAFGPAAADGATLALAWGGGIALGYGPMLAMFLFVPGMFRIYVRNKVLVFFDRGGIDLQVAVPWPWKTDYSRLGALDRATGFLTGALFLALPVTYLGVLGWALLGGSGTATPHLIASCLVGLCYYHHATSRSDLPHLCQVMQPFLGAVISLAALAGTAAAVAAAAGLLAMGWLLVRRVDAFLQWVEAPGRFESFDLLGDRLVVPSAEAGRVARMQRLVADHVPPEETLFIAPDAPLFYPVLGKETPVYSDLLIFPESEAGQRTIIDDLERRGVNWALTRDFPRDGRDELRFRNTHARVWAYLEENFERIPTGGLDRQWDFWRRRSRTGAA